MGPSANGFSFWHGKRQLRCVYPLHGLRCACPSGALSSVGKGCLVFREFQCHQCGLCRETCPKEQFSWCPGCSWTMGNRSSNSTSETELFRCVECGVPFASPPMIDRIKEKLASHWMYANEQQLRRLQMCRTCRTRDSLISGETGSRNQ